MRLGQFHGVLALLDLLGAVTLSLGREMFEGTTDVGRKTLRNIVVEVKLH